MSTTKTANLFSRNESDPSPREIAERAAEVRARRHPTTYQVATNKQRRREGLRPLRDFPMVTIRMSKEDRQVLNQRAAECRMSLQAYCYNLLFPAHLPGH